MFHTIWVHLGPFGCVMKLGAKRDELVQKFVPRSRDGIFRTEGTLSTPLDPKLMCLVRFVLFGCIWDRFIALQNAQEHEFRVQWHGSGAFVVKNFDATSLHKRLH